MNLGTVSNLEPFKAHSLKKFETSYSYGDVQTYTLSYIELTSLQSGERLRVSGYYDEDENGVRHFFTQNADFFNIVFVEGFFDAYGKYSEFLVNVQSIDEDIPVDVTGAHNNTGRDFNL